MIYQELFWTFIKIGAFTFGGGYAMLPLIQEQAAAHGWLTDEQLIDFIAVSESTPGPFAVNMSTYVGMETGGIFGAFCATVGVVLPSFLIILLVAKCFSEFQNSRIVKGCMSGLKPAVVGLIAAAAVSAGKTALFPTGVSEGAIATIPFAGTAVIFGIMLAMALKKVHPILIIVCSALLGIGVSAMQGGL